MCTLNDSLKQLAEKRVNDAYVAGLFKSFRHDLVRDYFADADKETLAKEIAAFDSDTKNGTCKVIIAASTKVDDKGRLLDDDGNIMEKTVSFAVVKSTNKDGDVIKERQVFRFPYVGNTIQRNISIVRSWIEFRATREDSFAYMKQLETEKVNKEIAELTAEMTKLMLAGEIEKAQEIVAKINTLKK